MTSKYFVDALQYLFFLENGKSHLITRRLNAKSGRYLNRQIQLLKGWLSRVQEAKPGKINKKNLNNTNNFQKKMQQVINFIEGYVLLLSFKTIKKSI